jgi:excisionase family DNA binding protein
METLLTAGEVAKLLNVSVTWVLDHASRRRPLLQSVKLGKVVRFREADVRAFVQECERIRAIGPVRGPGK